MLLQEVSVVRLFLMVRSVKVQYRIVQSNETSADCFSLDLLN